MISYQITAPIFVVEIRILPYLNETQTSKLIAELIQYAAKSLCLQGISTYIARHPIKPYALLCEWLGKQRRC